MVPFLSGGRPNSGHGFPFGRDSLVRHAGIVDVGYHRVERQFDADTLEFPQVQTRWVKPCQIRGAPSIERSRTAPAITPVAIWLAIARTRKSSHSSASSCSGSSSSHVAYVAQR